MPPMRKISADLILPVSEDPIANGVVVIEEDGTILSVDPMDQHDAGGVEKYEGIIVPGFVNTHCHLELSHMKGMADTGTGLLPFLKTVVNFRDFPEAEILEAIDQADQYMYDQGIVAVGDISNKLDTAARKEKSEIRYHTFVEMFDFRRMVPRIRPINSMSRFSPDKVREVAIARVMYPMRPIRFPEGYSA